MNVNDLMYKDESIFRILKVKDNLVLVINCLVQMNIMWFKDEFFRDFIKVDESKLLELKGISFVDLDKITNEQMRTARDKYATISAAASVVGDPYEVKDKIKKSSILYQVSAVTLKNRLYEYLVFQDIRIFIPAASKSVRPLTQDEKNFRWALNKYYYNGLELPLKEAYRRMLKDRYCDEKGTLLDSYPSYRQFDYYFRKTVKQENLFISRKGKGDYMRNHRTMLGEGIRECCPTIGYGMFDSTVCDIYLVNDNGELVGRPILTACVDAYSSLCMGYSLGFKGGMNSLNGLIKNINKKYML